MAGCGLMPSSQASATTEGNAGGVIDELVASTDGASAELAGREDGTVIAASGVEATVPLGGRSCGVEHPPTTEHPITTSPTTVSRCGRRRRGELTIASSPSCRLPSSPDLICPRFFPTGRLGRG